MVNLDTLQLSDIPDRINLDNGFYGVVVEELKKLEPKEGEEDKYKLSYMARFRVETPEVIAGMAHFERYYLGSDVDPLCDHQATIRTSRGFNALKKLFAAVGLGNMAVTQAMEAIKDQRVIIKVRKSIGKSNGVEYVNIDDYFNVASDKAALIGSAIGGSVASSSTAAAVTRVAPVQVTASTITCGECKEDVPRDEYGKHAVSHRSEQVGA